jgi:hypothetical protein
MGAVDTLPAEEKQLVLGFGKRARGGSFAMVSAGLGPACKKFIAEFETTCAAKDAPAVL